jgi:iron-sulfur cluster repair protein YtfE (RIC family)
MTHECSCHAAGATVAGPAPISEDQTVGQAAARGPAALAALERLGINHCCGAGLSLREAAAAAGVPLDALLAALRAAA